MLGANHLTLQSIRLKGPKEWVPNHSGFLFVLPSEGSGKYVGGSITQNLARGDVHVSSGSAKGRFSAPKRGEIVLLSFAVQMEHLFPLLAAEEIPLLNHVTNGFTSPKLFPAAGQVARECHRLVKGVPASASLAARSQLLRAAIVVLGDEFKAARRRWVGTAGADQKIDRMLEGVSSQELLSVTVEDLAARLGCTRRHLNRLFHQRFGFSIAALRMEMRMLKAACLLRNPDAKVSIVAEECGFNHLGLFNACFKKRFSISPGAWREAGSDDGRQAPEEL